MSLILLAGSSRNDFFQIYMFLLSLLILYDYDNVLLHFTDVISKVNSTLESGEHGRLFAVVHIRGSQFKVTAEDILTVKYEFPPNVGDRIRLEKVLI